MAAPYNHREIEEKWLKEWETNPVNVNDGKKPKYYCLDMFPYPSGNGLHVGHWRGYVISDVWSRYKMLNGGHYIIHPMGWDAFGLPAENYAIKMGVHPAISTADNVSKIKSQIKQIAALYDWDMEVNTTDPSFYKWTQWIFVKMFKAGLAYEKEMPINWCPSCKTGLANEEVVNGKCERCGADVTKKNLKQWMLKITAYADRLLNDLDKLDWPEKVKKMQTDWIGKSYGAEVDFPVDGRDEKITVYTTRPDTLHGATFMVLAPEHSLAASLATPENKSAVEKYIYDASMKSNVDRLQDKEKTGVFTGTYAINPLNGAKVPIWLSDYVLADYGTGAIMCVPAHDDRDFEFAKKFDIPIIQVIAKDGKEIENMTEAYTEASGTMINSGEWNGMESAVLKKEAPHIIEKLGIGRKTVNYKLRDWVFSRQRYWGEPIPIVHCPECGCVPVPEDQLPLLLPEVESYQPTGTGESPLADIDWWVNTTCPVCGAPAKRETNTMPQWAGSSWYFLRYMDPHCKDALASKEALEYWSPVDWYNGGMEHTTLHLLYSRFWHKFLYDIGAVPSPEPYQKRTAHGMILGLNPHSFVNLPAEEQEKLLKEYGSQKAAEKALEEKYGEMARHPIVKMSKSLGNVINPDEVVDQYGADTMRLYEMFMGDFEQAAPWQTSAIAGCSRFLDRVWALSDKLVEGEGYRPQVETLMHQTIKKVGADIETLKMNTAIAQLMTLVNALYDNGGATKAELETVVQLLNPFAPHMTEELWEKLGHSHDEQLAYYPWPKYEEAKCVESTVEIAVQVNGKVKARLKVAADIDAAAAIAAAKADPAVAAALEGKQLVKEIYVKGRLVNLAVKG